jgi:hypothetical protein
LSELENTHKEIGFRVLCRLSAALGILLSQFFAGFE